MKNLFKYFPLMLIVVLLTSCTQRRYSNLTFFKHQPKTEKKQIKERQANKNVANTVFEKIAFDDYSYAPDSNTNDNFNDGPDSYVFDTIYFKNGDITLAKVTSINNKDVTYQPNDSIDEVPIVAKTKSISEIRYSNPINNEPKKIPTATIVGFILSVLLVTAPLGLVYSLIGWRKIRKEPDKYKGKIMALIGIFVGAVITAFYLIMLLTITFWI